MYYNFNPMFNFKSQVEKQIINNPKFKDFYEANKDKTPEQVCKEYNLDWETVKRLLGQ